MSLQIEAGRCIPPKSEYLGTGPIVQNVERSKDEKYSVKRLAKVPEAVACPNIFRAPLFVLLQVPALLHPRPSGEGERQCSQRGKGSRSPPLFSLLAGREAEGKKAERADNLSVDGRLVSQLAFLSAVVGDSRLAFHQLRS